MAREQAQNLATLINLAKKSCASGSKDKDL